MKIDVLGSEAEGLSVTIVTNAIIDYLKEAGHEVVFENERLRTFKEIHKSVVIVSQPETFLRLMLEPFTVSPRLILNILLSNWEEMNEWTRKAVLTAVHTGKTNSTPVVMLVHSRHSFECMISDARKWFTASAVQIIARSVLVEDFGISSEFRSERTNNPDLLVVPYNRITQTHKNLAAHVKESRRYAVLAQKNGYPLAGHDFFHAQNYDPKKLAEKKDIGTDVYTFKPQFMERADLAENLRHYGLFLSTSMTESFGIYYLELLMSGVVGVFFDRPWVHRLLPGYRYVCKNGDASSMLLGIRENYQEASDYLHSEVIPYIKNRYSLTRFMERVNDVIQTEARPEKESQA